MELSGDPSGLTWLQVEEQASPAWERLVLQCGSDASSTAKSYSRNTSAAAEVLGGQQVEDVEQSMASYWSRRIRRADLLTWNTPAGHVIPGEPCYWALGAAQSRAREGLCCARLRLLEPRDCGQ